MSLNKQLLDEELLIVHNIEKSKSLRFLKEHKLKRVNVEELSIDDVIFASRFEPTDINELEKIKVVKIIDGIFDNEKYVLVATKLSTFAEYLNTPYIYKLFK